VRALESSIREAITNIVRHSRATQVRVEVREDGGEVTLGIHDNGRAAADDAGQKADAGIEGAGIANAAQGVAQDGADGPFVPGNGLRNVRYRIASAGGQAEAHAGPRGFTVSLRLPVGQSA
jgi:two-component system, NarL family, sensor histidine kinase DesK